jgi:hypothetical protein
MFTLELYKINVQEQKFDRLANFEPVNGFKFSQKLNGVGELEFSQIINEEFIKLIQLYSTCVLIKKNNVPIDVYFIQDIELNYSVNQYIVNFNCLSWLGHLIEINNTGRYTDASQSYINEWQETIAWDLIDKSQQKTNGWLGIVLGNTYQTKKRDRNYEYYNIGQAVINLSNVIEGFDFDFKPHINADGNLQNIKFNTYNLKKGKLRTDLPPISLNSNVESLSVRTINGVWNYVLGIGSGNVTDFVFSAENTNSQQFLTRREKILDLKDISIFSTLENKVNSELDDGLSQDFEVSVKIVPESNIDFFDLEVGDFLIINKELIPLFETDRQIRLIKKQYNETPNSISFDFDFIVF